MNKYYDMLLHDAAPRRIERLLAAMVGVGLTILVLHRLLYHAF